MVDYKRLTDEDWLTTILVNGTDDVKLVEYAFKLWHLENQIKSGTLLELPCKVGDTVYTIDYDDQRDSWVVNEVRVYWFLVDTDGAHPMDRNYKLIYEPLYTEAEVKAKLEELIREVQ